MKKRLPAFTLIETIIVMAIFSMIMYSVMQLMGPVTQYFVRSANFENSTACLDNMRRCIEGNLMYADRVRGYAGYEPYHYSDSDGDGIVTSTYAPSEALKEQVTDFYKDFFKDRVCFDASGTIYVLCFDNTQIANADALSNLAMLSDYSDQELNQGKILLYEFPYDYAAGVYSFDPNVYTFEEWTVNQKLYGNFDYTFYLGSDGTGDDGKPLTDNAALLGKYTFTPTDCKIHIKVAEVMRAVGGGLTRASDGAVYQNAYASFVLENALQYGTTAYTSAPQYDMKIIYDPTLSGGNASDPSSFVKKSYAQVLPLVKFGTDPTSAYDVAAKAAQGGASTNFYFIFTTPDSTNNVDPVNWGITVETT